MHTAATGRQRRWGGSGSGVWEQDQHLKQLPAQAFDLEAKTPPPHTSLKPITHAVRLIRFCQKEET